MLWSARSAPGGPFYWQPVPTVRTLLRRAVLSTGRIACASPPGLIRCQVYPAQLWDVESWLHKSIWKRVVDGGASGRLAVDARSWLLLTHAAEGQQDDHATLFESEYSSNGILLCLRTLIMRHNLGAVLDHLTPTVLCALGVRYSCRACVSAAERGRRNVLEAWYPLALTETVLEGQCLTRCDIGSLEDVAGCVRAASSGAGPLTGVVHAGGVLQDAALRNQTAGHVRAVFAPKIGAATALTQVRAGNRSRAVSI